MLTAAIGGSLALVLNACTTLAPRPLDTAKVDIFNESTNWSTPWLDQDMQPAHYSPSVFQTGKPTLAGDLPGQESLRGELLREVGKLTPEDGIAYIDDSPPEDLWDRVREGYGLPYQEDFRIDSNLRWFQKHPAYINRMVERAGRYLHYIVEEIERRGIPSEIALLPVVESAFQPFAYSHGRASGIWQFIPSTGKLFKLKQNWWYDGRRDIVASTTAALDLLEQLHAQFDGDWFLALAAYNSGAGTVQRSIKFNRKRNRPTDFWNLRLPKETEGYVPKLIAIAELISQPEKYGIELAPIPNEPYMAAVEVDSQIDLALAAELAEVDLEEVYLLNPGFNRWATDPNGPHRLMLPIANAERFEENLAKLPPEQRIKWERHTIGKGETLLQIAERYSTTVDVIRDVNKIRRNNIRAGQSLIIPVSTKSLNAYMFSAEQRRVSLQNTPQNSGKKVVYSVRRGDTMWSIAKKFGVNVRVLAKWNGMAPRDPLQAGQDLVIWSKSRRAASTLATRDIDFTPNDRTQKIRYRVRRGDSLAAISRKFQISVDDLLRWNDISKDNYLRPGQRLTLFVDVTRQGT